MGNCGFFVCFLVLLGPVFKIKFSFLVLGDVLGTEISGVTHRQRKPGVPPPPTPRAEELDSPSVVRPSLASDKSHML